VWQALRTSPEVRKAVLKHAQQKGRKHGLTYANKEAEGDIEASLLRGSPDTLPIRKADPLLTSLESSTKIGMGFMAGVEGAL
jgi:hypothetical protein